MVFDPREVGADEPVTSIDKRRIVITGGAGFLGQYVRIELLRRGNTCDRLLVPRRRKRLVGYNGAIAWDASRPDGQPRRCLDVTRAKALFGFTARIDLETGLQRTIASFLEKRL